MEHLLHSPKGKMGRVGDSVRGRCPTSEHEDANPSFSFKKDMDAWACSCGGGKGSELRARLNWTWSGAREHDAVPRLSPLPKSAKPEPAEPEPEREWAIKNTAGEIVCYHIRRPREGGGKSYSWRVPGQAGEGLHGLKGADLPLYGSEKLSGAPEGTQAIVVEGEKAADALQAFVGDLPLIVLGTVTGASSKPSPAVLEVLKGRKVHLWPDHDDIGRLHMERIGEMLEELGIPHRKILWKGAKHEGDDAADFIARGGTLQKLNILLGNADWRATFKVQPVVATELAPLIDAPIPYIVKPIIVKGSLTQIQGAPKGGKSAFSLYLSLCAATDTWPNPQYLHALAGPCKVLYIAWEDPKIMMAKRLSLYAAGLGFERTFLPERLTFLFAPDLFIEQGDHVEALKAAIKELQPDIIFIDTLSHAHLCDENAASEMKIPMKNLDRVARETETGIVYLHHTAKGSGEKHTQDKGRGSGAIAAAWHVLIDWGMRDKGSNVNPVEVQSKYEHEWSNLAISYSPVKDDVGQVTAIQWSIDGAQPSSAQDDSQNKSRGERRRARILETLRKLAPQRPPMGWCSAQDIAEFANLGIDDKTIRRTLETMCEDRVVEFKPGERMENGKQSPNLYRAADGNLCS